MEKALKQIIQYMDNIIEQSEYKPVKKVSLVQQYLLISI